MSILWTETEDAKLLQLHAEKKTASEIARIMNRSWRGVKARLSRLSDGAIKWNATNRTTNWTEGQETLLLEMRSKGHTFGEIGQHMGKSLSACRDRFYQLLDLDAGASNWPPKSDPWAVKVNFAEHDVRVRSGRTIVKHTDHSEIRSLVGNSSAMCAR